ncbi:Phosphoglucomutase, first 3 domain-containing protein [Martensiomyces pterosporus]|nr:Phosphoglucomutase, first 3 domain-containing protein [Martensiomyces pterosporus]
MVSVRTVPTRPHEGQKPGTSGLRKRVVVFQQENYTENFVQAIFTAMPAPGPKNATVVVGGDGRYYMKDVIQKIIRIGAGNGIAKFIIGQNGILSTPAASAIIRKHQADGGIILTASHNPGGPKNDFGIKYNTRNGGPAPEAVTDAIYEATRTISSYSEVDLDAPVDLSTVGTQSFDGFEVEIVDSVEDYVQLIKSIFDFDMMTRFREQNPDFTLLFDALNGVTGPYGHRIFVEELGFPESSLDECTPLEDFGGSHPDPNLTYAHNLVERVEREKTSLGAASDGDGDRNMVISHDWFVTPSDSVALIAHHGAQAIPYFKRHGLKGLARSMPTSCAIDRVAKAKGLEVFEVPTGWKFFGNLMDAGRLSICGEESFGTGSDHIREKDGIWAILAWLNIIAYVNQTSPGASIRSIMADFYKTYGRNYFTRYDYEEVASEGASQMIDRLRGFAQEGGENEVVGREFYGYKVAKIDDFAYTDPIDHSVSKKQGVRVIFDDSSRIIFRLSGTGSEGATVRIYIERFDQKEFDLDAQVALKPLVQAALEISKLEQYTGRKEPTVIT